MAYTPIGCNSILLTGPSAPNLATTACYAIFSGNSSVANAGISHVTGDIGTNVGLAVGYDPLLVNGTIHSNPDGSTSACAADLLNVYSYLNTLTNDIELLYPAQFGQNLVLTPHTYTMKSATFLTDTLSLNAQGNPDAVFVIKTTGALGTSSNAKVLLINGTQAKNVYWKVDGAVSIGDYSQMNEFNYSYTDQQPYSTSNYRISETDNNGRKNYYSTIQVKMNLSRGFKSSAYVQESYIYVQTSDAVPGNGSLELYSIEGKKVSTQNIVLTKEASMYKINKPRG